MLREEAIFQHAFHSATGESPDTESSAARLARVMHGRLAALALADQLLEEHPEAFLTPGYVLANELVEAHVFGPRLEDDHIEESLEVVALGDSILNAAKERLEGTDFIRKARALKEAGKEWESLLLAYEHFSFKRWRDAHPDDDHRETDGITAVYGASEPSPQRLADWPYGERMNCLGISIGLAAFCELTGFEYLYATRIRNGEIGLVEDYKDKVALMRRHLRRLGLEKTASRDPDMKDFAEFDLGQPEERMLHQSVAFHHSVIVAIPDEQRTGTDWYQLDPYQLNFGASAAQ